jgi:hypothetical protein
MELLGRFFAALGAGGVLFALLFVSLLAGVLVNGMIILMSGKLLDEFFRKKGEQVFEPGSIK